MNIKKAAGTFLLGFGSVFSCFTAMAYRYTFCRNRGIILPVLLYSEGHDAKYYMARDAAADELARIPCTCHTITSPRGVELKGFYYTAGDRPSGKIAFIVHGYHSNHLENGGLHYKYYIDRGFDVFMPDNPACGESGGNLLGFGYTESEACLAWLDFLGETYGSCIKVLLHGFSLGGCTVAMMSDRVPDSVRLIVDDCGFTSGRDILKPSLGPAYGLISFLNRVIAGFSPDDCNAREHVLKAKVPMLFVHGRLDKLVPFRMGEEMYKLCPVEKDCYFVDTARHVESMYAGKEGYEAKLDEFIEKHFCPQALG